MLLGKIVQPEKYSAFKDMLNAKIWNTNIEDIEPVHLEVFFYQMAKACTKIQSQKCVNLVTLKIKEYKIKNDLNCQNFHVKNYIKKAIYDSEFSEIINKISKPKRDCIMFALNMNWSIEDAIVVTRKEAAIRMSDSNEQARRIFKSQPVHLFNQRLFCHYIDGEARMLITLRMQIKDLFGVSWDEMLSQFNNSGGRFFPKISKEQALMEILGQSSMSS